MWSINPTYFLWTSFPAFPFSKGKSSGKEVDFLLIKKNWTRTCDCLETSNLSADNFKKNTLTDKSTLEPRDGHVILVSGCLFWQLSIEHNMDVQYQVAGSQTTILDKSPWDSTAIVHHFRNFLALLPPPNPIQSSGYRRPTLFVWWGEELDRCELENTPETQKYPKTFVHDYLKKRWEEKRQFWGFFKPVRVFFGILMKDRNWTNLFPAFGSFLNVF